MNAKLTWTIDSDVQSGNAVFCRSDYLINQLSAIDSYPPDFQIFNLNGSIIGIEIDF